MNIKKELVNDRPVRYTNKNSLNWVVACDLAYAIDISPATLHRYISESSDDDQKIVISKSNAYAIPTELALCSINNLLKNYRWKQRIKVKKDFTTKTKNLIAFLEQLQNPLTTKNVFIRFVGTSKELEWVAMDVVAALYPNDKKSNCHNRLRIVNDKWKSKKRIDNNGRSQEIVTIFKPGIDELIKNSNSARGELIKQWITKQIEVETQLLEDPWDNSNNTTVEVEPEPVEDVITPVQVHFMERELRFVGTEEHPEWIADDILTLLHPKMNERDGRNYLAKVNDKWKGNKRVETSGGAQELITINSSGVRQLITRGNSQVAKHLQEKLFIEGEPLDFLLPNKEIKEAETVIEHHFMGANICFVGTPEEPEWIVRDILQVLYPDVDEEDCVEYLARVDSKWLDAVWVYVEDEEQIFTTIYKPGLFELIAKSGSPIARLLQERILEQLDFINSQYKDNFDMHTEETDFDSNNKVEDMATQEVITPTDFSYMGQIIRFVGTEEKPEWVAADPVAILYPDANKTNRSNYLKKINPKWKGNKVIITPGGPQTVVTLLEPGLWQLTGRSDSPIAVPFQEWLYEDVLPSIRKKGSYTAPTNESSAKEVFNGDMNEFIHFAKKKIDDSLLAQPIKDLEFVRLLRESFPFRKEFDMLFQTLASQDLMRYHEDITYRTYHSAKSLGVVYASKHNLDVPVSGKAVFKALKENNLIEKDSEGNWVPTDAGKYYCIIGWHEQIDGTQIAALQWKQETLLVLGQLH